MKKIALLTLVLLNLAFAKAYQAFDTKSILQDENGKKIISIAKIFEGIDALYPHASFSPVAFDNESDKAQANKDLQALLRLFDVLRAERLSEKLSGNEKVYFDLNEARVFVMAHNFDMKDFGTKAVDSYKKLLKYDKNGKIHNEYAQFLANTNNMQASELMFKKAIELNDLSAHYGLGLVYVALGKKDQGIAELEKYSKIFTRDNEAKRVLDLIKNPK
ncbi:MAG: hypothetical protein K5978_02310 [Campylobacter sp.]|nr:hypothetical protein [Campylobacter sp.]